MYNLSRVGGHFRWIVADKREEQEIEKLGCLNGTMWVTDTIVALTVI